eukprot:1895962-Pleurochrysis_carterae.AAC.1
MVKRARASAIAEESSEQTCILGFFAGGFANKACALGAHASACAAARVGGVADLRSMRRSALRS